MEKIKNILLIIFSLMIIILGLHWLGTHEMKSPKEVPTSETDQKGKGEKISEENMVAIESKENGKYHTISDPPDIKVFQTSYKEGTQILFNHKKHVEDYGLACIQCHHVENCSKCHLKNKSRNIEVEEGKIALHENCWRCHTELQSGPRECDECHKQ